MTLEEIKRFRELAGDKPYLIHCDNNLEFTANNFIVNQQDGLTQAYVLWDDELEVGYYVKEGGTTGILQFGEQTPVSVIQFSYDYIQYLELPCSKKMYDSVIGKLKEVGAVDDSTIDNMRNSFGKSFARATLTSRK